MFGSNPFGQSSSSPFGGFGQNTNANNSPFAPKPFGGTAPFGPQTGSSFFGSTATGVFGNQNSSPLGSTSVFGAASSPAFGSSTPAFGASSTTAFGSSPSPFGGVPAFGQKPAFGAFGSSSTQRSPFGSSFQQSQPAFGSGLFGSSSQSTFGTPSAPAFGSSSTPAFGATSTPTFGNTASSPFSSSGSGFGVYSFGSVSPGFGTSTTPAFGTASTSAFGVSSTLAFGNASTPAFGNSATGLFGASSASAFGTSTPAFNFGQSTPGFGQSAPAFGQSTSAFSSSAFGTTSSPFGAQTQGSPFGFGQSAFGAQRGGTRVASFTPTTEADAGTQSAGKLESISAMPAFKDKSHEDLRWEDYQLGDKGGPAPANQSTGVFGPTSTFGQTSANPFSSPSPSNPFAPKPSPFSSGFGTSVTSLPSSTPSSPFGLTSSTPSLFNSPSPAIPSATNTFGSTSSTSTFGTNSIFGSSLAQGSTNTFGQNQNFGNSQSLPLFQSTAPSLVSTSSPFGQPMSSSFGQSTPAFGQLNTFNAPSSGFGANIFSTTPSFGQTNDLEVWNFINKCVSEEDIEERIANILCEKKCVVKLNNSMGRTAKMGLDASADGRACVPPRVPPPGGGVAIGVPGEPLPPEFLKDAEIYSYPDRSWMSEMSSEELTEARIEFEEWAVKHGKVYATDKEREKRFVNYLTSKRGFAIELEIQHREDIVLGEFNNLGELCAHDGNMDLMWWELPYFAAAGPHNESKANSETSENLRIQEP